MERGWGWGSLRVQPFFQLGLKGNLELEPFTLRETDVIFPTNEETVKNCEHAWAVSCPSSSLVLVDVCLRTVLHRSQTAILLEQGVTLLKPGGGSPPRGSFALRFAKRKQTTSN